MKMKIRLIFIAGCILLSSCFAAVEAGDASTEKQVLFDKANGSFGQANSAQSEEQANELYQQAILNYEKIINKYEIQNPKLYYNLANAYLLKNEIGYAILNYRKAIDLGSSDTNIKKNLAFARSKRIDKIESDSKQKAIHTLLFWHYDFSMRSRFILATIFFVSLCVSTGIIILRGRKTFVVSVSVISAILMVCFAVSVICEDVMRQRRKCGVITARQITAYQGDSRNYPASFKDPLHEGTEFEMLEHRGKWYHIRLENGSEGWITDDSAGII